MSDYNGPYLVIYTDEGPAGICGQSTSITCPLVYVWAFNTEDEAYELAATKPGRAGSKMRVYVGGRGQGIRFEDRR